VALTPSIVFLRAVTFMTSSARLPSFEPS